jgi:hypothetical protein
MMKNKTKYLLNVDGKKYKAKNFIGLILKFIARKHEK